MAKNIYADVTQRIVDQLKAGVVPWRQPWSEKGSSVLPRNAVTGRGYSGMNVLLLWCTAQERGYAESQWLTYQQATEAGGQVRKGEKGSHIVFVSFLEKTNEKTGKLERVPFLKGYTVFNVAQCDGLVLKGDKPETINPDSREMLADEFLAQTGATIRHGESRAYFRPAGDFIMLPNFEAFNSRDAYYETAFHELTHWTGAEPRLNRVFGKRF
jgi:antirestriction protein ArdC